VRRYAPVTAKGSDTWAAEALMKLTFDIERNPHRRRFASA
jgi:hypothetical protein